jgi:hypothetical protein
MFFYIYSSLVFFFHLKRMPTPIPPPNSPAIAKIPTDNKKMFLFVQIISSFYVFFELMKNFQILQ